MSSQAGNDSQKTFLGHPLGLYVLFFTEMWERFSYYGMRALLIPYMVNYFRWVQSDASGVYKWYTSLVYVTPIIGGLLADRFLGNRLAVVIGAILMAIGHFLMAFEATAIFYAALVFLILGNGFFKPNMSTQVGRLYPANDPRRDGAYTIFYMGINLGAFLSPLVCGWLQENTEGEYHSGFAVAGIGMVFGLVIYLLGLPLIKEVQSNGAVPEADSGSAEDGPLPITEKEAETTPSSIGWFSEFSVNALLGLALILLGFAIWRGIDARNPIAGAPSMLSGLSLLVVVWVLSKVKNALRDRVLTIVALGFFGIFFWAAFEQAGNALNLWADKTTNRFMTKAMPEESKYPPPAPAIVTSGGGPSESGRVKSGFWNMFKLKEKRESGALGIDPVPTAWFQSINAAAIFVLAPLFAWLWVRWIISIPMKMCMGISLMSLSFVVMIGAAFVENQPLSVGYKGAELPSSIIAGPHGALMLKENGSAEMHPIQGGRLFYDKATKTLLMRGVLADIERDRVARSSASEEFAGSLDETAKKLADLKAKKQVVEARFRLPDSVRGFDLRYAGLSESLVRFVEAEKTLVFTDVLAEKDIKALLLAGCDPDFRDSLDDLMVKSSRFRVSPWWLFWSYIFATLGELCLSPVGLSMANKLAPARYSTMLMGLWLLVSAFGNFAAGALGETYGTIPPWEYFTFTTLALAGAAVVLLLVSKKLTAMMHGVR